MQINSAAIDKAVEAFWEAEGGTPSGIRAAVTAYLSTIADTNSVGDFISRAALLKHLCDERHEYFREHFVQDPATGTYEANSAKEEWLSEIDDRIALVDSFPAVQPVAVVINDNQPGRTAIIEVSADPPTLGVGTALYSVSSPS